MIKFLDLVTPDGPVKSAWKNFISNDYVIIIGLCILFLIIVFAVFKLVKVANAKSSKKPSKKK